MTQNANNDPPELKQRLRQLLSIPERERTDAQWDEIVDIEILLGPTKASLGRSPDQAPTGPKAEKRNTSKGNQPAKAPFARRKNRSA